MSRSEDMGSYSQARTGMEALGTVTRTPSPIALALVVSRPWPCVLRLRCFLHFPPRLQDTLDTSLWGLGQGIHLAWGWICLSLERFS